MQFFRQKPGKHPIFAKTQQCDIQPIEGIIFFLSSSSPEEWEDRGGWSGFSSAGDALLGICFLLKKKRNFAVEKTHDKPMDNKHNSLNITTPHQSHSKSCQSQNTLGNVKKFLKDVGVVLSVVVLLLIGLDQTPLLFKNNYVYKKAYLEQHIHEIKTLALGSSLTYNDIDPEILGPGTFNLGLPGKNIYYDVQTLEKYIDGMSCLETVIYTIHCDMMTMRDYGAKSPRNYMMCSVFGLEYPRKEGRIYTQSLLLSGNLNIGIFNTEVMQSSCNPLGMGKMAGHAKWRPPYRGDHMPTKEEEFTECLTALSKICFEHGVRLIAFSCPHHTNEFKDPNAPYICQRAIFKSIQTVQKKYPIEYKEYMLDAEFQRENLFYDWMHLNAEGARAFTTRIKRDFNL